jgi:hypothetical protein
MAEKIEERRRIQRVRTAQVLMGRIGAKRVAVIDLSLRGARVAHEDAIGRITDTCLLEIEWDGHRISLRCQIRRTQIQKTAAPGATRTLYHSGLVIVEAIEDSSAALRHFIEYQVMRALDEQKANAHGIPSIAPLTWPLRPPSALVRHELTDSGWHVTVTSEAQQPDDGFTVSADHSNREIQLLRAAFERGGASGTRELIRRFAQLSISATELVPARKYVP